MLLEGKDHNVGQYSTAHDAARARDRSPPPTPLCTNKIDIRLPGKGNSNSHGARPAHQIISMMIMWLGGKDHNVGQYSTAHDAVRARDRSPFLTVYEL